ncbi:MAG: cell division protein CrgA [Nocardioidaceae bacterium]
MPESRQRKKVDFTPPVAKKPVKVGGSRWIAPVMLACWLIGLAWIVVYYIAPDLKYVSQIGNWNLAIGMAFIAAGFVLATKWQ